MTERRKRAPEDFEQLLAQLCDETEDERRDFADQYRSLFDPEHGPVMGNDGDDNPDVRGFINKRRQMQGISG